MLAPSVYKIISNWIGIEIDHNTTIPVGVCLGIYTGIIRDGQQILS